jgi:hypothetical protein
VQRGQHRPDDAFGQRHLRELEGHALAEDAVERGPPVAVAVGPQGREHVEERPTECLLARHGGPGERAVPHDDPSRAVHDRDGVRQRFAHCSSASA